MDVLDRRPRDTGLSGAVAVQQAGAVDWDLARPLTYHPLGGGQIDVPAGFRTDGASVPRIVSALVPRSGLYLPAAVVHDWCYRVLVLTGQMTYQQADRLLREIMRRLGCPAVQRAAIFSAVRLAGLFRAGGRRGWWRDAHIVLPTLVVMLPLAVVLGVVTGVVLGVVALLELIAAAAIYVAREMGFIPPDRYINPPRDLSTSN